MSDCEGARESVSGVMCFRCNKKMKKMMLQMKQGGSQATFLLHGLCVSSSDVNEALDAPCMGKSIKQFVKKMMCMHVITHPALNWL